MTLARTTLKYGDVYFRASASRMVRSVFVSVIEYGLVRGIKTPIGAHPYCQSALSKQDNTSYYLCQCVLRRCRRLLRASRQGEARFSVSFCTSLLTAA